MTAALNVATQYDAWFDKTWGRYAFAIEERLLLAAVGSVRHKVVLDIGCGTGRFTGSLKRAGAAVIGLDRDAAMLSVASSKLAVPLVLGDALVLPFVDDAFDMATAVTVCEFTDDHVRVVGELARVVRPGGRIVLGSLNPHSPWGLAHRRRFRMPPWEGARFLTWRELGDLDARFGDASITTGLYAPGVFPGLSFVGPIIERLGKLLPRGGAFRVLSIVVRG